MKADPFSILQLAACYLNIKRFNEAEEILRENLKENSMPEMYYFYGAALALQGKNKDAIEAFKNNLLEKPENHQVRELIFHLLISDALQELNKGNYTVLSDILTDAIKYSPDNEEANKILNHFKSVLPISYLKNEKRDKAAALWLEEYKKSDLSNVDNLHNLALLYYWWALSNEEKLLQSEGKSTNEYRQQADELWRKTFMFWFAFLYSDSYWTKLSINKSQIWKVDLKPADLSLVKSDFANDNLFKKLEAFEEKYLHKNRSQDVDRIKSYISHYFLEKKTVHYWNELQAHIRLNGFSKDPVLIPVATELKKLGGPFGVLFLNEFYPDGHIQQNAIKLLTNSGNSEKTRELGQKMHLFYTSALIGQIISTVKDLRKPELALELWKNIDKQGGLNKTGISKDSAEAQYLFALILFEKGKQCIVRQQISEAITEWTDSDKAILKAIKNDKDKNINILISSLQLEFFQMINEECTGFALKMNKSSKYSEAIAILEQAYNITKDDKLKSLLCANYCDKAFSYSREKKRKEAREFFEKALKVDKNYGAAKRGLSISYNDEGISLWNDEKLDKAIEMLEKAVELEKDDTGIQNLTRAYNEKAVNILNAINQYSSSSTCDTAINLLIKALKLTDPAVDFVKESASFAYWEESRIDYYISSLDKGLYKSMLKNLWVAHRTRKNLRGY